MANITFQEILEATGGRLLHGKLNGVRGISIDSRTMREGDIFVALKGLRFDGHDFIHDALNRGFGAIVSVPPVAPPAGKAIILVDNTLRALQGIARHIRKKMGIPVVGITGTNGKTTTKEMAASILGRKYRVLKNTGNLNNQVGLPLSLLSLAGDEELAVLEMGASAPGDIRELCGVALPEYGVLTNIGPAHIEGFRDIESVRSTKLELLESVGTVILNADDHFLVEGINGFEGRVIRYGMNASYDVSATDVDLGDKESSFALRLNGESEMVRLRVTGMFNVYNALAAAAVGHVFDVGVKDVCAALDGFEGVPMRLEIKEFGGATVISDVYNANPASMEEALKEMIRIRKRRAIPVLGDMLDLGSYSESAHRALGRWMCNLPIDLFIAVGPNMAMAADEFRSCGGRALSVSDAREARGELLGRYMEGDTVLIKGSRDMQMEKVLENAV
jgi:UDP-N-acetylmuramoyl-tripeptide--D-alanyl-D-alanine ligase